MNAYPEAPPTHRCPLNAPAVRTDCPPRGCNPPGAEAARHPAPGHHDCRIEKKSSFDLLRRENSCAPAVAIPLSLSMQSHLLLRSHPVFTELNFWTIPAGTILSAA